MWLKDSQHYLSAVVLNQTLRKWVTVMCDNKTQKSTTNCQMCLLLICLSTAQKTQQVYLQLRGMAVLFTDMLQDSYYTMVALKSTKFAWLSYSPSRYVSHLYVQNSTDALRQHEQATPTPALTACCNWCCVFSTLELERSWGHSATDPLTKKNNNRDLRGTRAIMLQLIITEETGHRQSSQMASAQKRSERQL